MSDGRDGVRVRQNPIPPGATAGPVTVPNSLGVSAARRDDTVAFSWLVALDCRSLPNCLCICRLSAGQCCANSLLREGNREADQRAEDAELRQESQQKLVWYETQYEQELAVYTAVCTISDVHPHFWISVIFGAWGVPGIREQEQGVPGRGAGEAQSLRGRTSVA